MKKNRFTSKVRKACFAICCFFLGNHSISLAATSHLSSADNPTTNASSAPSLNTDAYRKLASQQAWLALLHYEPATFSKKLRSSINTADFFLSTTGKESPLDELNATIAALKSPAGLNTDTHAQCRFAARFLWLSKQLPQIQQLKKLNCKAYKEWSNDAATESISIVFAAGHLKSPASYFGHNFLKFNASKNTSNFLLDQTINYGANVPEDEGGLTYFYNGIFGKYSAVYERQQFFQHMAQYGEEDLRDVWEYELDLNPDEVEFIVAHAWELQSHELTYYFFRENCAYQIAKLLSLVTAETLIPKYVPWTMPFNIFNNLAKIEIRNRPLIKNITYHPSRRSRFHHSYFSLNATDKKFISNYAKNNVTLESDEFINRSKETQLTLIESLTNYYEFRLRIDPDDDAAKEQKKTLLLKRFSYPPGPAPANKLQQPYPPHLSQKPGYLNFEILSNSSFGNAKALRFRPAYFDFLSLDIGRNSGGEFTLLDTTFIATEDEVALRSLEIINISNLAASVTGVPGDSALSWRFRLAFSPTNLACTNCRRPMLDWSAGKAIKLGNQLTGFALAGARLQKSFNRDNTFAAILGVGVTGQLHPQLRIYAALERHEDTGSNGQDRNRSTINLRLGDSRHWDIRLRYINDVAEELGISAGYYW